MIRLENVRKLYFEGTPREAVAIENANLTVENPGAVILKGPSGSGKSTLLSIVGALNKPSSGDVEGEDCQTAGEVRQRLPPGEAGADFPAVSPAG